MLAGAKLYPDMERPIDELERELRDALGPRLEKLIIRRALAGGWLALWPCEFAIEAATAPTLPKLLEAILKCERRPV